MVERKAVGASEKADSEAAHKNGAAAGSDTRPGTEGDLKQIPERKWHAVSGEEVLEALEADVSGLSTAAAEERLSTFGPNRLPQARSNGPILRLALQFHNLLIYVLLASALVSLLLGHPIDAGVIMGVVIINAVIGFVQEGKAERALEAIRGMIDPRASVLRDGRRVTLPADQIVPGDVVLVEAGDRVAADLRLLRARSLKIEEAVFTGDR